VIEILQRDADAQATYGGLVTQLYINWL